MRNQKDVVRLLSVLLPTIMGALISIFVLNYLYN